jgi:hypothetical protein
MNFRQSGLLHAMQSWFERNVNSMAQQSPSQTSRRLGSEIDWANLQGPQIERKLALGKNFENS